MTQRQTVFCIGECMVEFSPASDGHFRLDYAGDTYTTAVYMKRLYGDLLDIAYVTALGDDPQSKTMLATFAHEGLETRYIRRIKDRKPGLYLIQNDETGERFFQYWRSDSAARYMFDDMRADEIANMLKQADLVYLSGITLAICRNRSALLDALTAIAGHVRIAFDPNFRSALWPDISEYQTVLRHIGGIADQVFVTPEDEKPVWGEAALPVIAKRWRDFGTSEVIVKDGAAGCYIYQQDTQTLHVPPATRLSPLDTTGAGDSFSAAYTAARLTGKSAEEAAALAHDLAGKVVMHRGAIIPADHFGKQTK